MTDLYKPPAPEVMRLRQKVNDVYEERNLVILLLLRVLQQEGATVYRYVEEFAPDWPVVGFDTPVGQISWHLSPDNDVDWIPEVHQSVWDGHTTEEKYHRVKQCIYGVGYDD